MPDFHYSLHGIIGENPNAPTFVQQKETNTVASTNKLNTPTIIPSISNTSNASSGFYPKINYNLALNLSHLDQYDQYGMYLYSENIRSTSLDLSRDFVLTRFLTYRPDVGIGETSILPYNVSSEQILNDQIGTYQYGDVNQTLQLGPSSFYLNMQHTYEGRFTEPPIDIEFGKTIINHLAFNQFTSLINGFSYRGSSGVDLRTTQGEGIKEIDHTRFDDFNNLFDMTLIRNIYFSEDYIYSIRYGQPLTSNMLFNYSMANLNFPQLDMKGAYKFSTIWNHSFQNPRSSNMTIINNLDFDIGKYWKLHISTHSLNENLYLYSQSLVNGYQVQYLHRNFITDLLNSINIFSPSVMKNSYFKLKQANISVDHDLHCWTMSFGYSLNQRFFNYGATTQYPYLESSVWLKISMKIEPEIGMNETVTTQPPSIVY